MELIMTVGLAIIAAFLITKYYRSCAKWKNNFEKEKERADQMAQVILMFSEELEIELCNDGKYRPKVYAKIIKNKY